MNLLLIKIISRIIYFIPLIILWISFVGLPTNNTAVLTVVAVFVIIYYVSSRLKILPTQVKLRAGFVFYFFWLVTEIYKSAFGVICIICRKQSITNAGFKWISSNQQDKLGVVIYANSITLTPGTIAVDVKDNKILVHALDIASIEELKQEKMSKKVTKVISG